MCISCWRRSGRGRRRGSERERSVGRGAATRRAVGRTSIAFTHLSSVKFVGASAFWYGIVPVAYASIGVGMRTTASGVPISHSFG